MSVHATPFRSEFLVAGMSCPHCAMSAREEICDIPGVSGVDIELISGRVTVVADRELARQELADAVAAAGYELVG